MSLIRFGEAHNDVLGWQHMAAPIDGRCTMRSLSKTSAWFLGALLVIVALSAGCGRDGVPTSPSVPPARTEPNPAASEESPCLDATGGGLEDRIAVEESGRRRKGENDKASLEPLLIGELPCLDPSRSVPEFPLFVEEKILRHKGGAVDNGLMRVLIPADALGEHTYISIARDSLCALADFGPSGTQFSKKVTLRFGIDYLEMNSLSPQKLRIYWWNGQDEKWEALESEFDPETREIVAQTEHFSRYALSD